MKIDILQAGAAGDGIVKDTSVVQTAIDACGEAGGGVVTFPAGKYLIGKVYLRSHVTVVLESGAHIIASPDKEDYPTSLGTAESYCPCPEEEGDLWIINRRWSVFYGCDLEDVILRGPGMIDGDYKSIMVPRNGVDGPLWACHEKDLDLYAGNGFRPVLVFLENCHYVKIEDLFLYHAACYTMNFNLCTHMQIQGVRIENALGSDNADGMHITSCSDVLIANCDLTCGDDAIAIDTNEGKPSERFVITNCIISSRNNCFRLFHSLHCSEMYKRLPYSYVRDISISSCVIRQGDSVVCINADQGEVSQIMVRGITGTMTRNGAAFLITAHNNSKVDRVIFEDWFLTCRGAGYMYAEPGSSVSNIDLVRMNMVVCPKTQLFGCGLSALKKVEDDCPIKDVPAYWWSHHLPFFMQIVNIENVNIENITIDWGEESLDDLEDMESSEGRKYIEYVETECHYPKIQKPTRNWPAVRVDNSENFTYKALKLKPHGDYKEALVVYKDEEKILAE